MRAIFRRLRWRIAAFQSHVSRRPRELPFVDLSGLPTFRDPDPLVSERHDEHLGGA